VNVATEDKDVGIWIGPWDTNEGNKAVPRPDATVEIVVLPGLAMMREGLSDTVSVILGVRNR